MKKEQLVVLFHITISRPQAGEIPCKESKVVDILCFILLLSYTITTFL